MATNTESSPWVDAQQRFYATCNDDELHRFFAAKNGKESRIRRRKVVLPQLEKLDRKAVFQLGNLPPELRLDVIRQAISEDSPTKDSLHLVRASSLLRVSKLIHRETADVLYNEVPLRIVHRVRYIPGFYGPHSSSIVKLLGASKTLSWGNDKFDADVRFLAGMMPNVLKFKQLILEFIDEMDTLQLPAMLLPEPHFRSEACAYALSSLLEAIPQKNLESITVEVPEDSIRSRPSLCWPLFSISNVTIAFSNIKADAVQELMGTWKENPALLVLASWCKVQAEAETLLALFTAAEVTPKGAKTIETQLQVFARGGAVVDPETVARTGSLSAGLAHVKRWLHQESMQEAKVQAVDKLQREGRATPGAVPAFEVAKVWPHRSGWVQEV
ncbi:hypothetical protein CKM354_001205800 [Cercospora kikuchii]|uniref:F-box domain-containing protein n=1 Tax=Cercospora kikuchii TaxID=84275 RepID=A0A9P3CTH0_9PEZI|nr:uncharacterized protein CKM354_001205800 [Cercospora kikuchii]GIZ49017.1 hypothetical protein CKM354_001205800 [Cercospora kikuchii]